MATKLDILKEIYQIDNDIKILKGEDPLDLTNPKIIHRIEKEADEGIKITLVELLKNLKTQYQTCKDTVERKKKVDEYFATPVGIAHKSMLEENIEKKREEWKAYDIKTAEYIDGLIKEGLGIHWGLLKLGRLSNGGILTIGVINEVDSTPERKESYFGQDIEIRYECNTYRGEKESFRSSCASCGDFALEGGDSIGERAMFYTGIGKLYGSKILIYVIKNALRSFAENTERLHTELESLKQQFVNPTGK